MDKLMIKDMRFYGYHGVYEKETKEGQPFLLQAELWIGQRESREEILDTTVNYADCYELVKEVFSTPFLLLENLALSIMEALFGYDKRIERVCVRIEKLRPPVPGDLGSLGVELCREREFFSL